MENLHFQGKTHFIEKKKNTVGTFSYYFINSEGVAFTGKSK